MKPSALLALVGLLSWSACAAPGETTGGDEPPVDEGDGDGEPDEPVTDPGGDGAAGATHECYGIADDLGEVFAIDRETGQAAHMCPVPGDVAEIDAISSHPVTGTYYYVSQSSAELGWFDPDTCAFETIGAIDVTDLAGLSFHPETAVLYAGDQSTNELYRFGQDAGGAPTAEVTLVATLDAEPKAIAIQPATNLAYVSDATDLLVVDLASGETVETMPMSKDSVEALFFTVDGALHGVTDHNGELADHFVDLDPATGEVTAVGPMNPVAGPAAPDADDVEAMECNVGGVCTSCGID